MNERQFNKILRFSSKIFLNGKSRSYIITSAVLLFVLLVISVIVIYSTANQVESDKYLVVSVIDGDTITVRKGLTEERVRYIGVDTPEITHNGGKSECYAQEAKEYNEMMVLNKYVILEGDKEERDRYGRLLKYVYITDGDKNVMVNKALITDGYAKVLRISPNVKYADTFKDEERRAKESRKGLWGKC
jgi:micrococcal nuclease